MLLIDTPKKVGKNFLKAQISVFLAWKIDDLNLALSAVLYKKLNPIVHVLMQTVVSNKSCHWQKKASSCPHNLTSPPPLLTLAQVQLQHWCRTPAAWAPAPPWVPRQPWAGAPRITLFPSKHPHPVPRPALPLPLFWHLIGSLWRMAHTLPPQGAMGLGPGLHLSPRGGGFTEPSFESIWSWWSTRCL